MKKITCLSAIACIALTSCREEPADSGNQTIGVNHVVVPGGNISDVNQEKQSQSNFGGNFFSGIHYENPAPTYYPSNFTYVPTPDPKPNKSKVEELREKFTHVDNYNWFEFKQKIKDFESNRGKVSGKTATIKDNKLTFEILGVRGTIDLRLKKIFSQQGQFKANIDAIQWFNDRGGKLEFPLNINTFPSEFSESEVYSNSFGSNLDKIKEFNYNNHNKKFSVEKGVVKLDDNDFLKLDSLNNFYALTGALTQKNSLCFFDDTFFKNPITWKPNGEISFYGGEKNCVLFEKINGKVFFGELKNFLKDLVSMQEVQIPIDKIKIEQTNGSIKLGGCELDEDIWTDYDFWDTLKQYVGLFNYGDGIRIEKKNDVFFINDKPIKNVDKQEEKYLIKNPILKPEPAN